MNPFTESTVARPLTETTHAKYGGVVARTRVRRRRGSTGPSLKALLRAGVLAGIFLPALSYGVDVNSATPEQLRGVRGIGPKTAETIVEERTRGGRYESIEDLSDRVKGIGPKKATALQAAGLTVGKTTAASATPAAPQAAATQRPKTR
ncbi:helix-hairpin-helix domain-containing protein [Alcaligenaceae bacterium]|nr:helix-hairpin-helix domain-containing protein [Alcaligenaceae bacterium]